MVVNSDSEKERIIIYEETFDTILEVSEKGTSHTHKIICIYFLEWAVSCLARMEKAVPVNHYNTCQHGWLC